jgi:hypothetical protein
MRFSGNPEASDVHFRGKADWISRLPRADYDRVKLGHCEFSFWAFFTTAQNVRFWHKADIDRGRPDVCL